MTHALKDFDCNVAIQTAWFHAASGVITLGLADPAGKNYRVIYKRILLARHKVCTWELGEKLGGSDNRAEEVVGREIGVGVGAEVDWEGEIGGKAKPLDQVYQTKLEIVREKTKTKYKKPNESTLTDSHSTHLFSQNGDKKRNWTG